MFRAGCPRQSHTRFREFRDCCADYKLGDIVDIPSPGGTLHLPIAGIVTDYSDQQGSILMDRALIQALLERRAR